MTSRNYALDVFRGMTVLFMILVNNPGSWEHSFSPLQHAAWHGCTPTDLVFPFFLFAVGNSLAFSFSKFQQHSVQYFLRKTLTRTALIFLIGLFLNASPFFTWQDQSLVLKKWENLRIMGVLQRIALCYFLASFIIYYTKSSSKVFKMSFIILILYWIFTANFGGLDPYSLQNFIGNTFDHAILGTSHLYRGEGVPFDPEGLLSTIAATCNVLFGYYFALNIKKQPLDIASFSQLLLIACGLVFIGFIWNYSMPINKKIWTSSYAVLTSGLAAIGFLALHYIFEIKMLTKSWGRYFDYFGTNPLFIFVLSGVLPRVLGLIRWQNGYHELSLKPQYTSPMPWFAHQIQILLNNYLNLASFIYAFILVCLYGLIAFWLYKRKIYIKI